jgi:membrane protease YdiL (CAAX protease family)
MSRNLYILAATLFFFAIVSWVMMTIPLPEQTGLPQGGSLWRMIGFVLFLCSAIAAVAGTATAMYEQVERRNQAARERGRRRRSG